MNKIALYGIVAIGLMASVVIGIAYGFVNQPGASSTATTIVATAGNAYHPPGCTIASSASGNGLTLQIEDTNKPLLGSDVCLHVVLTNTGSQPISVGGLTLYVVVKDSSGNIVYHNFFPASAPPSVKLNTGQVFDGTAYWDTSKPFDGLISPTVGTYTITASCNQGQQVLVTTSAPLTFDSS
jgi:hypothetical protein